MRKIDAIVLHHSACENTFESIRAGHIRRGWGDVYYHYVIDTEGHLHKGRPLGVQAGARRNAIEICVVGRLHIRKIFPIQEVTLLNLLARLNRTHENLTVKGHNDFTRTLCPGSLDVTKYHTFIVNQEIKNTIRKEVKPMTISERPTWKDVIIQQGEEYNLISEGVHRATDVAEKWFVIAVANRLMTKIEAVEKTIIKEEK